MSSREISIRATDLFQSHYRINANYKSKCVIKRWIRKQKTKSSQFFIEVLTKLRSFIDAYAPRRHVL